MSYPTLLVAGLLLVLVLATERSQDFRERWITRPPVEYEFPHVIYVTVTGKEEFCSGSLIHESWVLTAASCMLKDAQHMIKDVETSVVVYAGVKDRARLNDTQVQMRHSVNVQFPEDVQDDIYSLALIKVDNPFVLIRTLGVAVITVSSRIFTSHDYYSCKAGSHGTLNWQSEKNETKLKKLDVRSYECNCTSEMKEVFPKSSVNKWICGHTKDVVGICRGDFGMGLVCDGELQAVFVGLMRLKRVQSCEIEEKSSTVCRRTTNVGLFVDVCYYLQWLSEFVAYVQAPEKPCKALACHSQANLCFLWAVVLALFVYY